jgi:hypothetical protein
LVHYSYIFQMGVFVFVCVVLAHILILVSLLFLRNTFLYIQWIIIVEILTRNIYISTYIILSVCSQNFKFSMV